PEPTEAPRPTQPPEPTQAPTSAPVLASSGAVIQGVMPDGSPFWGNPNAPVVLHDYSDFL
ncbi:MAG: thioredoxin-like selenoprotein, partial [Anaerolineae bacterium]|nr:thioredoxin-like selenoprotein [Anaerolineae bacterium]